MPDKPYAKALGELEALRSGAESILASTAWSIRSHGDHDALGLIWTGLSHVRAVEMLGKEDVTLVLPGTAAARSAYDAVVMAAWLVEPQEYAERDRRWFGLLLDERAFWEKLVSEVAGRKDAPAVSSTFQAEIDRLDAIFASVAPQFTQAGAKQPRHPPSMDQLLDSVGKRQHYVSYKYASQFTHPTTRSLRQVRDIRDHGGGDGVVSFRWLTTAGEWSVAILLAAETAIFSAETLARVEPFPKADPSLIQRFNELVRLVADLGPGTASDAIHP